MCGKRLFPRFSVGVCVCAYSVFVKSWRPFELHMKVLSQTSALLIAEEEEEEAACVCHVSSLPAAGGKHLNSLAPRVWHLDIKEELAGARLYSACIIITAVR